MKPRFVTAVAILFCLGIFAIVAIFGYSRYKASQIDDARFQQQLQTGAANPQAGLAARMPQQLPPRTTNVDGETPPANAAP